MENEVKLTKLAKCAGCGAKVGAGVLAQLAPTLAQRTDKPVLVSMAAGVTIAALEQRLKRLEKEVQHRGEERAIA